MNFIFDPSLVLYLPLYERDGASFMSRDACGHVCMVTGALWSPQGRDLDGIDDTITCPANLITSGSWSWIMWINSDAQDDVRNTILSLNGGRAFQYGATGAPFIDKWGLQGADTQQGDTAVVLDTWVMLGCSINTTGTLYSFYWNGEADGTGVSTVLYPTDVDIGSDRHTRYYFNGTIGEVLIYNRVLTPQEIQHIYLATKWRYQ